MNRSDPLASLLSPLFGTGARDARRRLSFHILLFFVLWFLLGGFMILSNLMFGSGQLSLTLIVLSFIKYLPLLVVPFLTARRLAVDYLSDVFELGDEITASEYLRMVAFGAAREKIVIKEGHIPEEYHNSPLLQIGGPGFVQVNLDSAALVENSNGMPRVLHPRNASWSLERFEHLRPVGDHQYAVIDLRDQFIQGLSVESRTKDGIWIAARDIKILFSILRRETPDGAEGPEPHGFDPAAVNSLVYGQSVHDSPAGLAEKPAAFPWQSTILPLVLNEIEDLISEHPLGEILAHIGQKELDRLDEEQHEINKLKLDITGGYKTVTQAIQEPRPDFRPRSSITAQFYTEQFTTRAEALGVQLLWIDIGTWVLPASAIQGKHLEGWQITKENQAIHSAIDQRGDQARWNEFIRLLDEVVLTRYAHGTASQPAREPGAWPAPEKTISAEEVLPFEKDLGRSMAKAADEMDKDPAYLLAGEILRAIRKEMLAAVDLLRNDKKPSTENPKDLAAIETAIQKITPFTFHWG